MTGEPRSYEFDAQEKKIIDSVEGAFNAAGLFLFIYGIISVIGALDALVGKQSQPLHGIWSGAEGALFIAVGRYLRNGAHALKAVVKTAGDGMPKLMEGLGAVRNAMRFFVYSAFALLVLDVFYVGALFAARHFGIALPGR